MLSIVSRLMLRNAGKALGFDFATLAQFKECEGCFNQGIASFPITNPDAFDFYAVLANSHIACICERFAYNFKLLILLFPSTSQNRGQAFTMYWVAILALVLHPNEGSEALWGVCIHS